MLEINATSKFKKDRKRCIKRGYDMSLLNKVVNTLCIQKPLPPGNKDHLLIGNYSGRRECHITPDWLLIYRIEGNALYLDRTGTHSDLFGE